MNLVKRLRKVLNKHKELEDIFIFGSVVKSELKANDVDIALLINDKNKIQEIKKEVKQSVKNAHITLLDKDSIYSQLWLVLIREGFSVKKNKFLHGLYKIKPMVLYKYNLKKLTNVQKVQFTRGLDNFIKESNAKKLTRSVILVPITHQNMFENLLETWSLKYESEFYELLPLLRKVGV